MSSVAGKELDEEELSGKQQQVHRCSGVERGLARPRKADGVCVAVPTGVKGEFCKRQTSREMWFCRSKDSSTSGCLCSQGGSLVRGTALDSTAM